jgi:hypothetical protein
MPAALSESPLFFRCAGTDDASPGSRLSPSTLTHLAPQNLNTASLALIRPGGVTWAGGGAAALAEDNPGHVARGRGHGGVAAMLFASPGPRILARHAPSALRDSRATAGRNLSGDLSPQHGCARGTREVLATG